MILSDENQSAAAHRTPRALLILGILSLPFLPAAASGLEPQAPARDQAEPASAKPAERPSQPAAGNDRQPINDFIPQGERSQDKPVPDGQKIRVKASQPLQREVSDWLNLPGRFDSVTTVSVRPRVSGTLVDVKCAPGLKIVRGDLLFQIDPRSYTAERDKAEAEVRVARARLEAKQAEPPTDTRPAEIKAAEASLQVTEKALEIASLNLEFTGLRSPINGTIIGSVADPGNVAIADTTTLATIVSTDPMYVYFRVAEDAVLKLNRLRIEGKIKVGPGNGLAIGVGLQDEYDFPRTATLDFISGSVGPNGGPAQWRARVANRDGLILPGMSAHVRLPIGEPHKALLVAEQAVLSSTGEKSLNVVSDSGVFAKRIVTIAGPYDGMWAIEQGLKANEWVVVGFLQPKVVRRLPYGTKVDMEKVPMPEGAASGSERRQ